MTKIYKPLLCSLLLAFAGILLAGCEHTVQGFGQDMENSGKAIKKSVDGNGNSK
ncbi:MAG TPA: entericidin A/B family lipoprotein [Gammaproteobacteria bacterium]|jgi:predicted small secreted protein|nr:entericidin A/B family lipoprotein [Gammaproteobacteria bacterium]